MMHVPTSSIKLDVAILVENSRCDIETADTLIELADDTIRELKEFCSKSGNTDWVAEWRIIEVLLRSARSHLGKVDDTLKRLEDDGNRRRAPA